MRCPECGAVWEPSALGQTLTPEQRRKQAMWLASTFGPALVLPPLVAIEMALLEGRGIAPAVSLMLLAIYAAVHSARTTPQCADWWAIMPIRAACLFGMNVLLAITAAVAEGIALAFVMVIVRQLF